MKNRYVWIAALLPCSGVQAHDVWLWSEPARAQPGATVRVGLTVGEPGNVERVAFDPPRIERLSVTSPEGRRDVALGAPQNNIELRLQTTGTTAVAYVSKPATSDLAPHAFDEYLREEHLDQVLTRRKKAQPASGAEGTKPVREHYSRSLKTLIGVGQQALTDCPLGLPLELSLVRADSKRLVVRASFGGKPLAGLWVDRGDAEAGSIEGHLTDANGVVSFARAQGDWILRATHMRASSEPGVDWRSWWATTVFHWSADAGIKPCSGQR